MVVFFWLESICELPWATFYFSPTQRAASVINKPNAFKVIYCFVVVNGTREKIKRISNFVWPIKMSRFFIITATFKSGCVKLLSYCLHPFYVGH